MGVWGWRQKWQCDGRGAGMAHLSLGFLTHLFFAFLATVLASIQLPSRSLAHSREQDGRAGDKRRKRASIHPPCIKLLPSLNWVTGNFLLPPLPLARNHPTTQELDYSGASCGPRDLILTSKPSGSAIASPLFRSLLLLIILSTAFFLLCSARFCAFCRLLPLSVPVSRTAPRRVYVCPVPRHQRPRSVSQ
ncbi:hypothetical protein IWX46DRAFT_317458 [Phyllosticta citricarpa]|uniref:Uncharacterized protein n=1 Tax=Phyllosticta citricarpa TaxID=55181 RepID=A0ABR1LEI7_9PEZI